MEKEIRELMLECKPTEEMTTEEFRRLVVKIPNAKSFLIEMKKQQEIKVSQLKRALKRFRAEKLLQLHLSKAKAEPLLEIDLELQKLEDKFEEEALLLSWLKDVLSLFEEWSLHVRKVISLDMEEMRGQLRE